MLQLMYITNNLKIAKIADQEGVNRIFIDLETIGKQERQPGDTVKSNHVISDIGKIKPILKNAELLVRVNPMHDGSKNEIENVIQQGTDVIMLPFFKTIEEVKSFLNIVNKRTQTCLLLETPEAVKFLDDVIKLDGIDEIHIGLNDLHLGYKKTFMFELLVDGTVQEICDKIKKTKIKYGFGGTAQIGQGMLPAEHILAEHYRLGSSMVILSRTFCNTTITTDLNQIKNEFAKGIKRIREYEKELENFTEQQFIENMQNVKQEVNAIVRIMKSKE